LRTEQRVAGTASVGDPALDDEIRTHIVGSKLKS